MTTKKQYAALGCYFGHWPNYFQFWLTSCKYNTGIDFFLVTDIETEGYCIPQNVFIIKMTFCELVSKIENIIKLPKGGRICCDRPYKICEFRTAYGHLFCDLFEGYDYWGFYDIDTIWGDILHFIPDNIDNHWLKIFPCGHLSFVRNIEPYTEVYKIIGKYGIVDWETAFSISKYHFLDEHGGLHPFFKSHKFAQYYYRKPDFDNIYPPKKRKWRNFRSINYPNKSHFLCFSYEEGHLYRQYLNGLKVQKEEISYLHISRRSMEIKTDVNKQRFVIYPNCFDSWKDFSLFSLIWNGKPRYFL